MKTTKRQLTLSEREELTAQLQACRSGLLHIAGSCALLGIAAGAGALAFRAISSQVLVAVVLIFAAAIIGALAFLNLLYRLFERREDALLVSRLKPALESGEVEVVEFIARRAWTAPTIDEDAPAAILDVGDGSCIYINTPDDDLLDESGETTTARSVWRFIRSTANNHLLKVEADPPIITLASAPQDVDEEGFFYAVREMKDQSAVTVRVETLPPSWRALFT